MRDRLIAWLWPALRPLVEAVIAEVMAQIDAAQAAQAATRPARRYMGDRRDG